MWELAKKEMLNLKGYVRKRGSKWSYTVDIGRDPVTNKRKQKTKSGFATEKEAQKALNEIIYELNKGIWIAPQKILMKDFALDWFKSYSHRLRDTTADQYEVKINKWIIPFLGGLKVQDLKPIHAQKFSSYLLENMSEPSAHKTYAVVKLILKHAVNLEIINKNPFNNVSLIKVPKPKIVTWTFDELEHFLEIAKKHDSFYYRLFATAAYTGLRKGELLALSKEHIDFENKSITVTNSIAETKKGVQLGELKTPSSYRKVAIDDFLISILKEQIAKNNEMKLKLGNIYKDYNIVFCHEDGQYYRPTSINRIFKRFIERSGVPNIRFHDLRHTHATLLLELGVNPKVVADRLGHSSVKITLDTYSHVSLDIQKEVAEVFSKRLKNA